MAERDEVKAGRTRGENERWAWRGAMKKAEAATEVKEAVVHTRAHDMHNDVRSGGGRVGGNGNGNSNSNSGGAERRRRRGPKRSEQTAAATVTGEEQQEQHM